MASVIENASQFRAIGKATLAGYVQATGCVSGANGAMGVHYARVDLIGDGELDPATPELLVYEPTRWGSMRLVAAEYLAIKTVWEDAHGAGSIPMLEGQHFFLTTAPNRFALPEHYMLHVWAFRDNPAGMFAPFNPRVSCAYLAPEEGD